MMLLETKNLKKHFKKVKAVDGVNLTVTEGECLGFLGPNGAGKSTTISMISTLIKPTEGEVIYKGENVHKNPKLLQKELGYVPQEIALYPTLSGRDNLNFWGRAYGLRGAELKRRLDEVADIVGIDERLKDRVKNYSGGMKRRLNIGAALMGNPKFIIMDEPTVGIDPQSRKYILDTVINLNQQGTTVIYTSHYMEEVEYLCNRICIMDKGKIIAQGTKQELVEMLDANEQINIVPDKLVEGLPEKVAALDFVDDAQYSDDMLVVTGKEISGHYTELLDMIGTQCRVKSFENVVPNLEAVFIHLTGRALRD
jgi:ABC-2 type transport system ATP-binding protein